MTKKDYEAFAKALGTGLDDIGDYHFTRVLDTLLPIFKKDNSRFNPSMFIKAAFKWREG